jgi:NADH:ubiquinone oxidoreductase subunit F (NADH-binding)
VGAVAIMGVSPESIIQGVLITGTAVYGNQVYKQLKKE